MSLIKQIEFTREYENELFEIQLSYGMRDNKVNHYLMFKMWHVTDKVKGVKHIVSQEDIIDITSRPNIYEPIVDSEINNKDEINGFIKEKMKQIVDSDKINKEFIEVLGQLEVEDSK
ncbi:hypothetical protein YJAMGPKP_CDS0077 [Staphylococcus phage PG-2021_46]